MQQTPISKTCRYGHGELATVLIDGERRAFGLMALNVQSGRYVGPSENGLVLDVYECPHCGYTELFERREP